ncbi:FecR family protein [Chitinophaga rupis]|uniref:FecR family protein n=1 Tax=Chitinophaga rupis TaxID=573321 RepID=A0A1H7XWU1_9BACT|nr:FecR domain-containing protein [Chitinophaga rupis]SEM38412.1 FecR family protein [Chitinophaga rupis]
MEAQPDSIYILTLKEIEGTISPQEQEYLYGIIADNEEAFKRWQSLHQQLGPEHLQAARESMQRHSPWDIITVVKRQRRNATIQKLSVAAILLLLISSGLYIFLIKEPQTAIPVIETSLLINEKQLQLTTPDGKILNLPYNSDTILQTDGVTFNLTGNVLHFVTQKQQPGLYTLNVPYGKDYSMILADGSKVRLNAGTMITFPLQFPGKKREIGIKGEAFLEIAQNASQAFIVHLPGSSTEVLGTSFNVSAYNSNLVQVGLVEGSVRFHYGTTVILLTPGKQVIAAAGKRPYTQPFDKETELSWLQGVYRFDSNASLLDVFGIAPRWYGITVQLGDTAALKQKRFKITLDRKQPLDSLLKNLQTLDHTFKYNFEDKKTLYIQ